MTFSGLRGAVGLILAIIVDETPEISGKAGTCFLFHIGGVAMLTISINASLAPVLLRKLGLTSPEKLEERVTVFFEKKVQGQARAMFATQSDTQQFSDVPRASVEKLLPDVWGGNA